ncbi:hypothetical protein AlacWU_09580 [Aspergillus niger]|nr:hypothetical protein AlacWU_09580 [Aspergillus niger]
MYRLHTKACYDWRDYTHKITFYSKPRGVYCETSERFLSDYTGYGTAGAPHTVLGIILRWESSFIAHDMSTSPFFVGLVATTKTVRAPSFLSDPIKRQGRREVPSFGPSPLAYPSSLGITTPHYSSFCKTPGASRLPES